jgi:hypothetical protein
LNRTQIKSDASHTLISADQSFSGFLGYLRKSRLFCVNLRSIAFDTPRPENLNGTQIKSDASHTLIFADQAKPGVWGAFDLAVICLTRRQKHCPSQKGPFQPDRK